MKVAVVSAALCVLLAGLAGVGASATHGAQTSGDEPYYLLTARSLATDGDLDLADELQAREEFAYHALPLDEQTVTRSDGRRVSPHDPLLPLLLAPAMLLPAPVAWVAAKIILVLMATLLAALTVWVAVRRVGVTPGVAAVVIGGLGASMPLAPYASQVYPEIPAALATMGAVAIGTAPSLRRGHLVAVACLVVALPWLAVKTVPVASAIWGLVAWRAWRDGATRDAAVVTGALALAGVAYLVGHQVLYGGWTTYAAGDHFVASGELGVVGTNADHVGRARRLVGLLVDRAYGIGMWTPLWLVIPVAVAHAIRSRLPHLPLLLVPAALSWAVATFVALTMHGWWSPGRQIVIILPLLAVLIAHAAQQLVGTVPRLLAATVLGVGVANWLHLAWRASTGGPVLIVDFEELANPFRQLVAQVAPDGIAGTAADDRGLVIWAILLLASTWPAVRVWTTRPAVAGLSAHQGVR